MQAAGRRAHDERGHQVLEHRSRPGDQRGAASDRRDGAPEPEPVARGDIALGDRHEAREARLRREQVVAARVEIALRDPVADREELALRVEQKTELHRVGHGSRRRLERREAAFQGARVVAGPAAVAAVTLDRSVRGLRPVQHFGAGVVAAFARQRAGDVDHGRGVGRDLRQSCTDVLRRHRACRSAAASASSASVSCCRVIVCVRRSSGILARLRA